MYWVGNKNSLYKTLGASSHSPSIRESDDYYATDPIAGKLLLELEEFDNILEPACGEGHLSETFKQMGKKVRSSDKVDRGYKDGTVRDFFSYLDWEGDIITNPPYKYAQEFVEHSLKILHPKRKVAMFLKIQFLEGKKRKRLFLETPPKTVYVSSSRILCAKNGLFAPMKNGKRVATKGFISSSAVAYGWFVWHKGFQGETIVRWFN